MKLTEWFNEDTKPVHIGVYEVCVRGYYSYWNGEVWSFWNYSIKELIRTYEQDIYFGNTHGALVWRGLAIKP